VELRYLHQTPMALKGWFADSNAVDATRSLQAGSLCSTAPESAENGVVLVRFSLVQGVTGIVTVEIDSKSPLKFTDGIVSDDKGRRLAFFGANWKWDRQRAQARFATNSAAIWPLRPSQSRRRSYRYQSHRLFIAREQCASTWKNILAKA